MSAVLVGRRVMWVWNVSRGVFRSNARRQAWEREEKKTLRSSFSGGTKRRAFSPSGNEEEAKKELCSDVKMGFLTDKAPMGDNERFSTVARNSSTEAEMGAVPLLSGLISTWIFLSISSSLSLSELE